MVEAGYKPAIPLESGDPLAIRRKDTSMKTLGRLWTWWQGQSDRDFYASMEIDTHKWANRSELLRRLTTQEDDRPREHEPEDNYLQLMHLMPRRD
jgi:hypothetical protein